MAERDDEPHPAIAMLRCGVVAGPAHLPAGTPGTGAMMRARRRRPSPARGAPGPGPGPG